ncbi:uncharacterized protein LOC123879389 [Maniola jurtina]|uniref:uncharacterized protein LOC123879389 n=1 Tax=Maniola jurtina TaxID=191418 RepID=UPI001E68C292|nr:uncharacterized protein LOC123879389 [Maniola jurtina]
MKAATIFLVAVTVLTLFLEYSTARNPPASELSNTKGDIIEITESFRQLVYKAIDGCKDGLANAQNIVGEELPKATGDKKVALTDFNTWLYDYLTIIIDVLPDQMIAAMDSGLVGDLKQIKADNAKAIEDTTEYMVGFNKAMPDGEVKDNLNRAIDGQVLYNANVVGDALDDLLSGL